MISSTSKGKTDSNLFLASILACAEAICLSVIGTSEDIVIRAFLRGRVVGREGNDVMQKIGLLTIF